MRGEDSPKILFQEVTSRAKTHGAGVLLVV